MSSIMSFGRHRRFLCDRAVSQAYSRLGRDERARQCFFELLQQARLRAPRLFDAPATQICHPGIEALFHLARVHQQHVRRVSTWSGSDRSWRAAIASLSQHLAARFEVPRFLSAAWCCTEESGEQKRRWYLQHGSGERFRSLNLPIAMTRRMEALFLSSPDHFEIVYAMKRAELLALGANDALTNAVLSATAAKDLDHGEFWRTVWRFLINVQNELSMADVAPLLDFLHAIRHDRTVIETVDGVVTRLPPAPDFSLRGRTIRSLLRLMENWHHELGTEQSSSDSLVWKRSGIRSLLYKEPRDEEALPPTVWELTELTTGAQLRAEGIALRHCVASYVFSCWTGKSRIFSLRIRRELSLRPVLTIEIQPATRTVVQARGYRNRLVSRRHRHILELWASKEGLKLAV